MSDVIIKAEGLGKKYMIRHEARESYSALRDVIHSRATGLFRRKQKKTAEEFWALKDIGFEIRQGEAVGIIGRNGAGKSTLLKILSRITEPTSGRVEIRGRVSSLLEVGTGFHPELTGRENIFLNGAVLGMSRFEIRKKFGEIVDFAGVEQFLDTPVKRYSSGMYLRLAFAIAAHLEPEILVVDEVLAVGDAEFQKKCLGKMDEVSKAEGRTVLFVSHNMSLISSICESAYWIDRGRLVEKGRASEVIASYLARQINLTSERFWDNRAMPGNSVVKLRGIQIIDERHFTKSMFKSTEAVGINMNYNVNEPGHVLWLGFNIFDQYGLNVFDTHSVSTPYYDVPHEPGEYVATAWIPGNLLNTGSYLVGAAIFNHRDKVIYVHERDVVSFHVYDDPNDVTARGKAGEDIPGIVRPLLNWEIKKDQQ
jgi:lipopolysaccharide transport system ATP-binding protein